MKFRVTTLAASLALLGCVSLGAHAASENLTVDNGSIATAQNVNPFGAANTVHVFGLRGNVDFFGTTVFDNDDVDYYSFTLDADRTLTLSVDTPEGPFLDNDPIVGLFSSDGQLLARDDDAGPGYDSLLSYTTSAAGTYFAAVGGYVNSGFGFESGGASNFQYNLTISHVASAVPVPAAVWLLGTGLLGLASRKRRAV